MSVTILDAWAVDNTYLTQDLSFVISGGSNRVAIICLSAEKNGSGPMAVSGVSIGDAALTQIGIDVIVGSPTAYHNINSVWYLDEAGIAGRTGSTVTITYSNAPPDPPAFDEPKMFYASYQDVDQTTPVGDTESNTNTSATSLATSASITGADGDKLVGFNVGGQHYDPGVSQTGWTEEVQDFGITNGHAACTAHRTATTPVTESPTFTIATATRMAVRAWVLKAADAGLTDTETDQATVTDAITRFGAILLSVGVDTSWVTDVVTRLGAILQTAGPDNAAVLDAVSALIAEALMVEITDNTTATDLVQSLLAILRTAGPDDATVTDVIQALTNFVRGELVIATRTVLS